MSWSRTLAACASLALLTVGCASSGGTHADKPASSTTTAAPSPTASGVPAPLPEALAMADLPRTLDIAALPRPDWITLVDGIAWVANVDSGIVRFARDGH